MTPPLLPNLPPIHTSCGLMNLVYSCLDYTIKQCLHGLALGNDKFITMTPAKPSCTISLRLLSVFDRKICHYGEFIQITALNDHGLPKKMEFIDDETLSKTRHGCQHHHCYLMLVLAVSDPTQTTTLISDWYKYRLYLLFQKTYPSKSPW